MCVYGQEYQIHYFIIVNSEYQRNIYECLKWTEGKGVRIGVEYSSSQEFPVKEWQFASMYIVSPSYL